MALFGAGTAPARADNLIVDGDGTLGPATYEITDTGQRRFDHVCVINGGVVNVTAFDPDTNKTDKDLYGNLELIAGSIFVDADSKITARGTGYKTRKCYHGDGPTTDAGGRGGCGVADSGGGGAHFGRGGRGTIDSPTVFDTHFEDNCDDCSSGTCTHRWDQAANSGNGQCTATSDCGVDYRPPGSPDTNNDMCPDKPGTDTGRFCKLGPSVAGLPFWHNIYEPEFGAAGGDKGCRDGDGRSLVTGGTGGGRIVLVGLSERSAANTTSPCGLADGTVRIEGVVDAGGKRGCGIENDSGGGGAGGTVLIVGERVEVAAGAHVSAAGGLGGDTRAGLSTEPDHADCPAGAQAGTDTCDDCGGGGGGGVISVLSVTSELDAAADFDVRGALGGVCDVCNGEAGGGAGELQLDGAYVGEFCDGYDNDFDGQVDEIDTKQTCGLGSCAKSIDTCNKAEGEPLACMPEVTDDPTCSADPDGARPRVAVILDTSASMLLSLDGYPTFGDGSREHPGIDVDHDGQPNDSRLFLARESLAQVISAYPEIDFALARYHQDQAEQRSCQMASWFECQGLVGTYDEPADNQGPVMCTVKTGPGAGDTVQMKRDSQGGQECINYAGSCGAPRRGADILSGFGMPARDIVRWLDGRELDFDPSMTPGNVCNHLGGFDCEVRGSGPTPLAGSLEAIEDYITPIRTVDPATECRGYTVILVTDGAESCNGDPEAVAAALHADLGIELYVIAVSVLPEEMQSLDAIAAAGSGNTRTATFVDQPGELVPALTSIIAGSIRSEVCNGDDDDCDGAIDEDFPGLGNDCDDGGRGICRGTGSIVCNAAGDGTECVIDMPPGTAVDEFCNAADDDCDGAVDEGLNCTTTTCTDLGDEICNGGDDDCDGKVDEDDPATGSTCGTSVGECDPGRLVCVAGMLICRGGHEPGAEQCNGLDDDCNGDIDDDAPCPPGSACIDGACRRPCDPTDEFPCPVGMLCKAVEGIEGRYCLPSVCATCKSSERCVDDERCVDRCEGVSCDSGERCVQGDCRDCHTFGCADGEVCYASTCREDPCATMNCGASAFCYDGACVPLCDEAACGKGEHCGGDGRCEPDDCADVSCAANERCVEGSCRDNVCARMTCPGGDVCVPGLGCIDDPCPLAQCPEGATCAAGPDGEPRCLGAKPGNKPSGGSGGDDDDEDAKQYVTAQGSGLFSCSVPAPGRAGGDASGLLMLLLALGFVRARRSR